MSSFIEVVELERGWESIGDERGAGRDGVVVKEEVGFESYLIEQGSFTYTRTLSLKKEGSLR